MRGYNAAILIQKNIGNGMEHLNKEQFWKALKELPDDLKMAITLREIEGLSYGEIAQAMECPGGTVRSRIFRARDAINKSIQI